MADDLKKYEVCLRGGHVVSVKSEKDLVKFFESGHDLSASDRWISGDDVVAVRRVEHPDMEGLHIDQ